MIICICYHVTEKQITDLLPLPLDEVMLKTNAGMCCGSCMCKLKEIVEPVSDNRSA